MEENTKDIVKLRQDPEFFFRLGMKYANRKVFDKALKFMKNAVEIKPADPDYQFNLACILAELGEKEKSNRVLRMILKSIEPTFYECYFCIGCNYFEMGKMERATGYFKKYISVDPDGQFADEAHEIIYYLKVYDDSKKEMHEDDPMFQGLDREWDSVIDCALKNREYIYKSNYRSELKDILKNYINRVQPEISPVIRKQEIWAAVLEYIYCSIHLIKITKTKLARKYRISPSSLNSKLKNIGM